MIRISTRVVFLLPNIVVKIPVGKRGYLQGKNEKRLFDKYRQLDILGELIFEFCGIVVMKKYYPTRFITDSQVESVKQQIPELNIANCDLYNHKNWGFKRKWYLIDYGINEQISKMYANKRVFCSNLV